MTEDHTNQITPTNLNLLQGDKFKFAVRKLPTVNFFCTEANIPGVAIKVIEIGNPLNKLKLGGNKVEFNELKLTFRVDEDLTNWKEIYNWIIGIGAPQDYQQFKDLIDQDPTGRKGYNIYSDATLLTLTNTANFNVELAFEDLFPVSLDDISLDLAKLGSNPVTAVATFAYRQYTFV